MGTAMVYKVAATWAVEKQALEWHYNMNAIHYFFNGFKLMWLPGIKRFVIIPLLLNTLLFIGLFLVAQHFVAEVNQWLLHLLPNWLKWLKTIVWLLFFVSFFLAVIYTYVTVANLISAPFNSLLAEKVIFHLTGKTTDNATLTSAIKDIPRICGRQLAIIGYYLPRAIGIGILFFIPIIQVAAAPLWFIFNAWFMALQYIDYPTDIQRTPISKVRTELKKKRWLNLNFGFYVLIASMIPILNLFVMPAAVAGATELWLKEFQT